jgi:hypothetical protein
MTHVNPAGVGHDRIDAAHGVGGCVHGIAQCGEVGYITRNGGGITSQFRCESGQSISTSGKQGYFGARRSDSSRYRGAYATGCAGHQYAPTTK